MYRATYPSDPGMHNMGDNYTKTTYRKNPIFFDGIKNSLFGIVIGIGILFGGGFLLFWNEGRAVKTAKSLDEGLSKVFVLKNNEVAFEENNNRLVYLSGSLKTKQPLSEKDFGITVTAVKLKRNVLMLQWTEHQSRREINEGDQTREEVTYSYNTDWSSELIDSFKFDIPMGHHNPKSFTIPSKTFIADEVYIGNFLLSSGLIYHINNFKEIIPSQKPTNPQIKLHTGKFYLSEDPGKPQVGDLQISFEYAGLSGSETSDKVSIIAKQTDNRLLPYQTDAGDSLELLHFGELSPQAMISKEHQQNAIFTWVLRFSGWLLMFVGLTCVTSILPAIVAWIPIVREIVTVGVNTVNFVLALSLSFIIAAIGWIFYRPFLGIMLIVLAVIPIFVTRRRAQATLRSEKLFK